MVVHLDCKYSVTLVLTSTLKHTTLTNRNSKPGPYLYGHVELMYLYVMQFLTFGVGLCGPYSYFGNIQSGYKMLSYLHGANPGKHSSVVECREARTTYQEL